jgi:hypothetical protein
VLGKIRALKKNEGTLSTVRAQRRHSLIDFPQQQTQPLDQSASLGGSPLLQRRRSVRSGYPQRTRPFGWRCHAGVHAVIALASIAAGQHCEKEGLTLSMGIAGLTAAELQTLLACGYD